MFKPTEVANIVQQGLLNAGFIVHRYDAYSTNSIYLKADYGMSGSVRISDHNGKHYLKYRFNIVTNVEPDYFESEMDDGAERDYYGTGMLEKLFMDMVMFRNQQIIKCGSEQRYKEKMKKYANESHTKQGFWETAQEVKCTGDAKILSNSLNEKPTSTGRRKSTASSKKQTSVPQNTDVLLSVSIDESNEKQFYDSFIANNIKSSEQGKRELEKIQNNMRQVCSFTDLVDNFQMMINTVAKTDSISVDVEVKQIEGRQRFYMTLSVTKPNDVKLLVSTLNKMYSKE